MNQQMGLLRKILSLFKPNDEPEEAQREAATRCFDMMLQAADVALDLPPLQDGSDTVAHGSGPFGQCAENPIPVNGIEGEFIYLARLRTKSGSKLFFHRPGSVSSRVRAQGGVDKFEFLSVDGKTRGFLFLDMYYSRRSRLVLPVSLSIHGAR